MTKTKFYITISGPKPLDCGECLFSSWESMDRSPHCRAEEFITRTMVLLPSWNDKDHGKLPTFCPIGKNRLLGKEDRENY